MPTFPNNRGLKSVDTTKQKALPAAAANNNSDSIDLGHDANHGPVLAGHLRVYVPATPSLVETKLITITLQDSADDSSFTAVTGVGTVVITGGASGGVATTRDIPIAPNFRRYVRINSAVESGGGSNIAISAELALIVP